MPDIHDTNGYSPLVIAARRGFPATLLSLIAAGSNVNKATFRIRATALHWSATNGHLECVRELLNAGCKVDPKTIHGRTPLMMAARAGHDEVVEELIKGGANVACKDYVKATALHMACEEGCTECAHILLGNGANINATHKEGETPLLMAARQGHADTMQLLLKNDKINTSIRGRKMTLLHWAAHSGNELCVALALQHEHDPDVVTQDRYHSGNFSVNASATPLMVASVLGHLDVLHVLVDAGASLDKADCDGYTAVLYAVHEDHSACVELLLSSGAEPNGVIDWINPKEESGSSELKLTGISPLLLAIRNKSRNSLKSLLKGNCNLSMPGYDPDGDLITPFELALSEGHLDICHMLIIAGCVVGVKQFGLMKEPCERLKGGDEETFEMLFKQVQEPPTLLQLCRTTTRKYLGRNAAEKIKALPLCNPLKEFLLLRELDSF